MDFQTRLKNLRKERGISQHQLARSIGVTPSSISAYETGIRTPQADAVIKLSDFFNVSTDYLLCVDEDTSSPTGATIDLKAYLSRPYPILDEVNLEEKEKLNIVDCCESHIDAYSEVDADFCVFCWDDSMEGFGIHENDVVFVKQEPVDTYSTHDLVAIVQDHQAIVRRINLDVSGKILYEASGRNTDTIVVDLEDENNEISLIGKAVGIQRML